ncbi:ATP-binding domain-containing protein [Micromonospora sp. NPDC053740]|uniref:ATP-binding domain-containing protein n=1 Tax=Micromonospora sp. NPDC053740 TaxID=3155173 RepID=UPI00343D18AE
MGRASAVSEPSGTRPWPAVRTPDSARGAEFDGVVVVEPRYFVRQEEFVGTLYTSLTRANRELVVVHSKPLPEPLTQR